MTFNDIFKSSFLESVTSFEPLDMVIALALSFALGMFIFFVYKKTFRGVMYSQSFGVSLMALTLITTLVILAITSNVVLSLGMVGALSIVRFRSAIKEPLDIAFLFWAIAAGIVLGAGLIPLAVLGSLVIGLILVLFVNRKEQDTPFILILHLEDEIAEQQAAAQIQNAVKKAAIKSKTVNSAGIELTMEVRLKSDSSTAFLNGLVGERGIRDAVLVSYNGDYMA